MTGPATLSRKESLPAKKKIILDLCVCCLILEAKPFCIKTTCGTNECTDTALWNDLLEMADAMEDSAGMACQ